MFGEWTIPVLSLAESHLIKENIVQLYCTATENMV